MAVIYHSIFGYFLLQLLLTLAVYPDRWLKGKGSDPLLPTHYRNRLRSTIAYLRLASSYYKG